MNLLVEWGLACAHCERSFTRWAAPSKADATICWICAARRKFEDDAEFGRSIVLLDPLLLPRLRYIAATAYYSHHVGAFGDEMLRSIARQETRRLVLVIREK